LNDAEASRGGDCRRYRKIKDDFGARTVLPARRGVMLIAGIVVSRRVPWATRNVRHFHDLEISVADLGRLEARLGGFATPSFRL
jgi:hypothetical protein